MDCVYESQQNLRPCRQQAARGQEIKYMNLHFYVYIYIVVSSRLPFTLKKNLCLPKGSIYIYHYYF
jgi:hypothetical protein